MKSLTRRDFLQSLGGGALALTMGGCIAHAAKAIDDENNSSRPNIVLIMVDDMGFSDIGCYGSEIPTPNLDALAANGLRFTQFYNTARCSPTRASLLTGLYPHQAGMGHLDDMHVPDWPGYQGKLNDECVTIAEVLKPSGYFTCMTGKWHVGYQRGVTPSNRGFDRSLNLRNGGTYFPKQKGKNNDPLFLNGEEISRTDPRVGNDWYSTYLWTEWGLKFIDEARSEKKPFFLYLAHCAPHFPLMAPQEDIQRHKGKYMEGWDILRRQRYERQIKMGLIKPDWPLSPRPSDSPAWDSLDLQEKERFDNMMAVYAAMIEDIDKSVGLLVSGLKERGVLDNTLLIFLSDNGGNAESGPQGRSEGKALGGPNSTVFIGMNWATLNNTPFYRYKHFTHEGGISSPLIIHWPKGVDGGRNGKFIEYPGHVIDIMPTCAEAAGAVYPKTFNTRPIKPMEGVSLIPAIHGKSLKRTAPLFFEHEGNRAVRDGKWKLVSKFMGPWELYDMEADRTETKNVIDQHPRIAERLMAAYEAYAKRAYVEPWPGQKRTDWGSEIKSPAS